MYEKKSEQFSVRTSSLNRISLLFSQLPVLPLYVNLIQSQAGFDTRFFVDGGNMPLAGAAGEVQGVCDFLDAFF